MSSEALAQLRDIHGLDAIPWWPPAPGWIALALGTLTLAFLAVLAFRHLRRYPVGSWQRAAWREWRQIRIRMSRASDSESARSISEFIRRVAMARLGRDKAAGLQGDAWLSLLEEHDPKGFSWTKSAELLVTLPYAPPSDDRRQTEALNSLLVACLPWIDYRNRHAAL